MFDRNYRFVVVEMGWLHDDVSEPMEFEEAKALFDEHKADALFEVEEWQKDYILINEETEYMFGAEDFVYISVERVYVGADERKEIMSEIKLHLKMANIRSEQYKFELCDCYVEDELAIVEELLLKLEALDNKGKEKVCCICGAEIKGYGNNPAPVVLDEGARCCDECNATVVIPARIEMSKGVK